jgi:N-acetylmuramoyl-L-alanine amidase
MLRKSAAFLSVLCLLLLSASNSPFLFLGQVQASQDTPSASSQAIVTGIRYWSGSARTRIVIDLDQKVAYQDHLLERDIVLKKPPRIYIDLSAATLSPHIKEPIPIEAGLLKRVRAGQYTPDTVRVVLDLENVADYKVFPLSDPFRVVIDVLGVTPAQVPPQVPPQVPQEEKASKPPTPQPQQTQFFKIVLDPGHGGGDPGAIGPTGLEEKDVVLKLSKKLRDKIKEKLGWEVVMTREDDRFIPLDERTGIANAENAALFLSIHANACTDRRVSGIESFFLGTTTDKDALRLAAKENNISPKQVSDLQVILADLKLNDPHKVIPSSHLAGNIQKAVVKSLHNQYGKVRDLGVKQAPFVVLVGAEMPSILVEVSFISNPYEERRLRDPRYLDALADAIVNGLEKYAQDANLITSQTSLSVSKPFTSN